MWKNILCQNIEQIHFQRQERTFSQGNTSNLAYPDQRIETEIPHG